MRTGGSKPSSASSNKDNRHNSPDHRRLVLWLNLKAPDDRAIWEALGPAVEVGRGTETARRLMLAGLGGQVVQAPPPVQAAPSMGRTNESPKPAKPAAPRKPTAEELSAVDRAADNLLSAFD